MADASTTKERTGEDWFEDTDSARGRESPLHNNAVTDSMRGDFANTGGTQASDEPVQKVQSTGTSGRRPLDA